MPVRKPATGHAETVHKSKFGVRLFHLPADRSLDTMTNELYEMMDVLLGREAPPINVGVGTLMEVAEAYHARAGEMEMLILEQERIGNVAKNSPAYRFRTGQLRTFQEVAKRAMDLGSRRVTIAQIEGEHRG